MEYTMSLGAAPVTVNKRYRLESRENNESACLVDRYEGKIQMAKLVTYIFQIASAKLH
jgi:hypothetical protein